MRERLYLDWNATAPLLPEARNACLRALESTGNASSVHAEGRAARNQIEAARREIAQLVGVEAQNVTFTSGATEANLLALTPQTAHAGEKRKRDRLLVSAVEHPSVLCGGRFAPENVEILPVGRDGVLDLDGLRASLARAERPLVSVMLANNETGVIQPIAEIAEMVHGANGLLHVDAVQGPGRIDCNIEALRADLMTISSHKIGGPQGAGALVRRGELHMDPLIKGGGQERGYRAGTENVAAIAGFGAAAAQARQTDATHMARMRDALEAGIKAVPAQAAIFGAGARRLPNTTLFTVPGMKAETAIIAFDLNGIAVSSGSACSSGKVQASHVLAAMGVDPATARGAVRVSLGWNSTMRDVERFLETWKILAESLVNGEARGIAA
jgi:cysteine desulfurase